MNAQKRSCVTCKYFNASYSICHVSGEIARPRYVLCPKWTQSDKDAEDLYEEVLKMLKIPIQAQTT